ncbi:MAG: Type 1 glutamine amidotransferase-like domain-containing protein [Actinomycetota bacterium]|nr:Type 1 glutamine amidotransferase-like domain-containing protein [Actinomycetota bacterium]
MRFAWLGSGEFEEWHDDLDLWLLEAAAGSGKVLLLPTASAREGDEVFNAWAMKGLEHYGRGGVPVEVVPLKTREDAYREDLVSLLDAAPAVFFSGGNPAYLADVLVGTPFWERLVSRLGDGLAYAGCSAGVACLPEMAPDSDVEEITVDALHPGLGLVKGAWLMPHWDMLDDYRPGLTTFIISSVPAGTTLVAIDETTAMVGDGSSWRVMGSSGVHVLSDGEWTHHRAGETFERHLVPAAS